MRLFFVGICFLLICFYFIWAKKYSKDREIAEQCSRNCYLDFFIPGVCILLKKLRNVLHFRWKGERCEQVRRMYTDIEESALFYVYYSRIGSMMAGILLPGLLLLAVSCAVSDNGNLSDVYRMERREVSGGENSVSFWADNGTEKKEITVAIPEREYTSEERERAFAEVKKKIIAALPGENTSLDKVSEPLVLLSNVPGYAIDITWELGEESRIGEDGSVLNSGLTKPVQGEITAVLSYKDEEQRVVQMITVVPEKLSPSGKFWAAWERLWGDSEEHSRTERYVTLPEEVDGRALTYEQNSSSLFGELFLGMMLLIILVPVWNQSRMRAEMDKRKEQLKQDYPEFVEHFVLLIGAGLTVRGTWEKIVSDYGKRQGEKHYVYEEMALSLREMDCGMSDARAYELFGKRTGLLSYMKFCTLIVQNLRKGSSDILLLLDYEVTDAFHQRKENAKELGEKAGTKLLLPMILMLGLVFVMILYAAFQSM